MTPERWQQIRAVFEQAEGLDEAERRPFLDRRCAADTELRREVESLLQAASQASDCFMARPAVDLLPRALAGEAQPSRVGRRIGVYKIVAEIGHGGMGEVYRAARVDGQFDQEVAIKLVRVGMSSSFVVQRFVQERQILASLNHPCIARLLDGGSTDDGVPYLAMELIDGERVDAYCESRKLSVSERLQLFVEICEAVQYAHQRLIVHRDIKPTNILVTNEGVPKLLDFGIAKILDPDPREETTLASPMTPEYASPEQIHGEPITTATDVYSLGVVLYKLLTGRSPYGSRPRTPIEVSRAIADTHPQRPSSIVMSADPPSEKSQPSDPACSVTSSREPTRPRLRRRLSGDIDNILLKALRKEPELRYGSVQQFADDISRHLNGLPVHAAKGSWSYLARKFVARHRAALVATAAVMLALTAGILATERQARIAGRERARAQKRFDDVRRFSDSLIFDVHDALQAIPGTTSARSLLLDRAVQYLDSVSRDAEGDAELQRELALGYQRLATVQGDGSSSNVGAISASELSTRKSMALFEAVAKANPDNVADQLNLATAHRQKGFSDVYYPDGQPEIEAAIRITDRLMRTESANTGVLMERALEFQGLALSCGISGDRSRSIEAFRQAMSLLDAVASRDPGNRNLVVRRAKLSVQFGAELTYAGALDKAREETEAGVLALQKLVDQGAPPDIVRNLAQSRSYVGRIDLLSNNTASAGRNLARARALVAPLAKADSGNVMLTMDLLTTGFQQGRLLVLQGRYQEAETQLQRAIDNIHKLGSDEDTGPGDGVMFAWLGQAQSGERKFAAAIESYKKAAKAIEDEVQYDDGKTGLITVYALIGDTLASLNRPEEAEAAFATAQAKSRAIVPGRSDVAAIYSLAAVRGGMAGLWMAMSDKAQSPPDRERLRGQSCKAFEESLASRTQFGVAFRFNPNEFPAGDPIREPQLRRACGVSTTPSRLFGSGRPE